MLDEHVEFLERAFIQQQFDPLSLPRACCASMRLSPPPFFAPARRSSSASRMVFMDVAPALAAGAAL
jgi:hypothetical protein